MTSLPTRFEFEPAADDNLGDRLLSEPERFEFTTAIRVAERIGTLQLVADVSHELAPTPIRAVTRRGDGVQISTSVGGLVGALGALPPAYTQAVLEENKRRSRSLAAFLDLFAERLLQLFVAASEKYRLPRLLRWHGQTRENRIVVALLALVGLRGSQVRARNSLGDEAVLRYAGFFAARTRNASALAAMLSDYSGLPVAVEQFRPRIVEIAADQQSVLAADRWPRLDHDAVAGATIRDHAGAFRIVVGPVGYADYLSLEPDAPRLSALMALARLFVGPALRFDVQVVLRREDIPFCRLGDPDQPPRLGWNVWARFAPAAHDSGDAVVVAR